MRMFKTVPVLGIPFINTTNLAFLDQLQQDIATHTSRFVVTVNPEIALYANNHADFKKLILGADYITPDGIGIIKGANSLGTPLTERITGYDTMVSLLAYANTQKLRIFLIGAKPEILQAALEQIQSRFPDVQVVGSHDGYFKDSSSITAEIEQSQPEIVFVALGSPKQEAFIEANRHLSPAIWMGVGGSFDVLSGTVKRAPRFWQNLHLEWFYRVLQNPTRIKRLTAIPNFLHEINKAKKKQL